MFQYKCRTNQFALAHMAIQPIHSFFELDGELCAPLRQTFVTHCKAVVHSSSGSEKDSKSSTVKITWPYLEA